MRPAWALYELSQDKVATRPAGKYYDVPAGKVRSRGLELEARTALNPQLSV